MIITNHNGNYIESNPNIIADDIGLQAVVLGEKRIELPKIPMVLVNGCELRYLTYGALTYILYTDMNNYTSHIWIYEQKYTNKFHITNYWNTTIIGKSNPLSALIKTNTYNRDYELAMLNKLITVLKHFDYMVDANSIKDQIIERLTQRVEEPKQPETTEAEKIKITQKDGKKLYNGMTLTDLAKKHNIDYRVLWNRVNKCGWPIEKALKKGSEL